MHGGPRHAWIIAAMALLLVACGPTPKERTRAAEAAQQGDTTPPPVATAPVVPAPRQPTAAEVEELVQLIDNDLRKNPRLTDAERQAYARQFAAEFIAAGQELHAEDARNRAVEAALDAKFGTPAEIKTRECNQLRVELAALQGRVNGTSTERLTDEERAALPAVIQQHQQRMAASCA